MPDNKNIEKKYSFSKEELNALSDIKIATISFTQAVNGMMINEQLILQNVYHRLGIDREEKEGYDKHIDYNLGANEIIVTYSPKKEEKPKEESKIILPSN